MTPVEVVQQIRANKGEFFESPYTAPPINEFGIMRVNEEKLFNDLSHKERISLSDESGKFPTLNIWMRTWVYLEKLKKWVCVYKYNSGSNKYSWNPVYVVVDDEYILDVDNQVLYKKVD